MQVKVNNLQDLVFRQFNKRHARKHINNYNDYDYNVYHTYDEVSIVVLSYLIYSLNT